MSNKISNQEVERRVQQDGNFFEDIVRMMLNMTPASYSRFDQSYRGGTQGNPVERTITLIGNAWRSYELSSPYEITTNTRLRFQATIVEEGKAHALCVGFSDHADTAKRCFMYGGTDFLRWAEKAPKGDLDLSYSKMVNLAFGREARQSSTQYYLLGDSNKAVDGFLDPYWKNDNTELNSITQTRSETNPWWEVELDQVTLLSEVVIHKRKDKYNDIANNISVSVYKDGDNVIVFEGSDIVDEGEVIKVNMNVEGQRVRVTLTEEGVLSLAEVIVLGSTPKSISSVYDVSLGDMLNEGIKFGAPVWNGLKVNLALDKPIAEDRSSYSVDLGQSHVMTDVIAHVSSHEVRVIIEDESGSSVYEKTVPIDQRNANGFIHVVLKPNTVGDKLLIETTTPTSSDLIVDQIQVIGNAEAVSEESQFYHAQPAVNYIILIQDVDSAEIHGKSIFEEIGIYEAEQNSMDSSKVVVSLFT